MSHRTNDGGADTEKVLLLCSIEAVAVPQKSVARGILTEKANLNMSFNFCFANFGAAMINLVASAASPAEFGGRTFKP